MTGTNDDLYMLYKEMEKYNFKKEFNVSVIVVEEDYDVERLEQHINERNNEEIRNSHPMGMNIRQEANGNDQITSVYFENTHTNYTRNNNNNEVESNNNNYTLPNSSANIQNCSETNSTSWINDVLLLQDPTLNSRPTVANGHLPYNNTENIVQLNKNYTELEMLSKKMIHILNCYHFYKMHFVSSKNDLLRKHYNERYSHVKNVFISECREIALRTILPQGPNFNVRDFLHKTLHYVSSPDKSFCTLKNLELLFNEIMASCYIQLPHPASHMNTSNNGNNLLQNNVQSYGHCNNGTLSIPNRNQPTVPENSQIKRYASNITHTSTSSGGRQYNNENNLQLQQNLQNNSNCSNLTQSINNVPNPAFREYDEHYNTTRTNYKRPNSLLLQSTLNEQGRSSKTKPTNDNSNSVLQELLLTDGHYTNNSQLINAQQKTNNRTNSMLQQIVERNQNHFSAPGCSSDQRRLGAPTTCIYQNNKIRLEVDSLILNNVINPNPINSCNNTDDSSHKNRQYTSNDVRLFPQPTESTNQLALVNQIPYQDLSLVPQEPTRSMSRDSGFMSPCNNQISDPVGEMQELTTPYITDVTSLNPKAIHIPSGTCYVCGKVTTKKCIGCYKNYYCSMDCQKRDWGTHQHTCTFAVILFMN